eukprot:ANDGO_05518.mRNA.1 hypothetical protein
MSTAGDFQEDDGPRPPSLKGAREDILVLLRDKTPEQVEVLVEAVLPCKYALEKQKYLLSKTEVEFASTVPWEVRSWHVTRFVSEKFLEASSAGEVMHATEERDLLKRFFAPEEDAWFLLPSLLKQTSVNLDSESAVNQHLWESWTSFRSFLLKERQDRPSDPVILHNVGVVCAMLGDLYTAFEVLNVLMSADPTNSRFLASATYLFMIADEMPLCVSVLLSLLKVMHRRMHACQGVQLNSTLDIYPVKFFDEVFILAARILAALASPDSAAQHATSTAQSIPEMPSIIRSLQLEKPLRRITHLLNTVYGRIRQTPIGRSLFQSIGSLDVAARDMPYVLLRHAVKAPTKEAYLQFLRHSAPVPAPDTDLSFLSSWTVKDYLRRAGSHLFNIRQEKLVSDSWSASSPLFRGSPAGLSARSQSQPQPSGSLMSWSILASITNTSVPPSVTSLFSFLGFALLVRAIAERFQPKAANSVDSGAYVIARPLRAPSSRRMSHRSIRDRVKLATNGPTIIDDSCSSSSDDEALASAAVASSLPPARRIQKVSYDKLKSRIAAFAPYQLDSETQDKLVEIQDWQTRRDITSSGARDASRARSRGTVGSERVENSFNSRLSDSRMASSSFFKQFGALSNLSSNTNVMASSTRVGNMSSGSARARLANIRAGI